ncbi:MAG: thiolase family protein [Cyanobacteria bacterium P01_A01_bin.135]
MLPPPLPTDPIIVAARRTPIGRAGGALKTVPVEQLLAPVLRSLLIDSGAAPEAMSDVVIGNAVGPGGNPARVALLAAGLPMSLPGLTVDRQCGSGLAAINLAARLVQAGAGEVYLAGGVESVSTAPWRIEKPQSLYELPRFSHRARFAPEALGDPDMGPAAEAIACTYGISRDRQDAYALGSHKKAVTAQQAGAFDAELVPVALSAATQVSADECPRPSLTLKRLSRLPPAFDPAGTVTAGNACPINDGAAAVVVMSRRCFERSGCGAGLRLVDAIAAGVSPEMPGLGPVAATRTLLARHRKLTLEAVARVEFNEAFAAQVLACADQLNLDPERLNVAGGAIALGHPYGASGAVLMVRLFSELVRQDMPQGTLGLATIGVGGGLGISTLVERVAKGG